MIWLMVNLSVSMKLLDRNFGCKSGFGEKWAWQGLPAPRRLLRCTHAMFILSVCFCSNISNIVFEPVHDLIALFVDFLLLCVAKVWLAVSLSSTPLCQERK